jgi:hypothetical protein
MRPARFNPRRPINAAPRSAPRSTPRGQKARRGVISLWLIVAVPVTVTLFCLVLEIANLWLARIELTDALESSALAAVKQWGDDGGGDTLPARHVAQAYAAANTIGGQPVAIDVNYDATPPGGDQNGNASCAGELIFGVIADDAPAFTFCTNQAAGPDDDLAVRAQATATVPSLCMQMFGVPIGPFQVSSRADALYRNADGLSRLYEILPQDFHCQAACPPP